VVVHDRQAYRPGHSRFHWALDPQSPSSICRF
jgi:hypothetical protein